MAYPCYRCGHGTVAQAHLYCDRCKNEVVAGDIAYADRAMRESRVVDAEWARRDKALSNKGGCAVLVVVAGALPTALLVLDTLT